MKKLLGLLALTLAVSGIASADQDVLKNINVSNELRQGWIDKDLNDAKSNEIGNAGFKSNNRSRTRWRKVVSGELGLVDEWGLDAKFKIQHDSNTMRDEIAKDPTTQKFLYGKTEKYQEWETNFELGKALNIGSLETRTVLGWTHKSTRSKEFGTYGQTFTTGQSNEIYVGPTFGVSVLGQNISTTLQAVYFNSNGGKSADYYADGEDFQRGKTEGWGLNANLATDGKIYEGNLGKVDYYVELNHKLRDPKGKIAATDKEAKSSVYLDYITGATYTTPSFAGFYGQVNMENEWEKHTATNGYANSFSIWTNVGYKAAFDTAVGEVTINPFVKYRPLHRETVKDKNDASLKDYGYKRTVEYNEVRAGLNLGLTVK